MTELNRTSEARSIMAHVLSAGSRLHLPGTVERKVGFRTLPSQSDPESASGARRGFVTMRTLVSSDTITEGSAVTQTEVPAGEIGPVTREERVPSAVPARRIFSRLRRRESGLEERRSVDTATEVECETLEPDAEDTTQAVQREPRFKIHSFSDLRGPKTKRFSLRPFTNKRETPHCSYHMPVWDGVSPRATFLEERREARAVAIADTKIERNVRLSYGIEEVWENIGELRRDFFLRGSAACIGVIQYKYKKNEKGFEVRTNEEVDRLPLITGEYEGGYHASFLRKEQRFLIDRGLEQWIDEREEILRRPASSPLSDQEADYVRLNELSGIMNRYAKEKDYRPFPPYFLILGGWNTAVFTIWALYDVSPEAFEDKYHRKPTKRELESLFSSSEHIAASFAVGLSPISVSFMQYLRDAEKEEYERIHRESGRMHFKRENFGIEEIPDPEDAEKTLPVLVIKDEMFEEFEKEFDARINDPDSETRPQRLDEDATGCPALYAKGVGIITAEEIAAQQKVKHVISEFAQWTHLIATELLDTYIQASDR